MLLPKGGVNWKAARARLPPSRVIWKFVARPKLLILIAVVGVLVLSWRSLSGTAGEVQRFVDTPQQLISFLFVAAAD